MNHDAETKLQAPADNRMTAQKKPDDRLQGIPYTEKERDIDRLYRSGDVYKQFGLTRDTLRYYEEIGLIAPRRSEYSGYRTFDLYDMAHLMAIDFYKKRGFTPAETKSFLSAASPEECIGIMQDKMDALEKDIAYLRKMRNRLAKTKQLYGYALNHALEFTIRELPPYAVRGCIGSAASIAEYRDKVLPCLDLENEDILSSMVRVLTFDEKGIQTSGIYIVEPAGQRSQPGKEKFLECGRCLCTTFTAGNHDPSVINKMYDLCHAWAAQHDLAFRGVAYIFIRFVMLQEQTDQNLYEVWIPLK